MLTAIVKLEVPAWKQPPPPGAYIPELPEDAQGRNMDFKEYLAAFRNSGKQTVDPFAFRDAKLGYVVLQEIEKVPEIWQNNKISRRNDPWATVGAATFNRTGFLVNMPTMAKIFHRGRTLLRDRIQRKIAAAKKAKQVIWDEDLERYLWTFPEHFALRFFREKLQTHITNCRTKDCFDANGEPIVFTIEDSEEEVEEEDAQEVEENHHQHSFHQNQIGVFDDMVIEENFEYDQQQHVHQNQEQDFEDVIEEHMIYEDDLLVENEVEVREEESAADNRFNEPVKNVEKFSSPTKPKNLLYHNQMELMQQQVKQQHQAWYHQQEERHQPRRYPMDQDQIGAMQQSAQPSHQQAQNLPGERHQSKRIPQQRHEQNLQEEPEQNLQEEPEQNLQEERLQNQAQARQAPPGTAQLPPTQRPQNVVFNPEVDFGFISHNLRRIGEEHPERQQLIRNVMQAYLEVLSSNLPAHTTPEDVYEYLAREYPNETGEKL